MTTLLVVPVIDRDFSLPCLDSIHPSLHPQLLVVDNCLTPLQWRERGVTIHRDRHNLGVARSWNWAITFARAAGHDAVAFISAQVRFGLTGGRDLAALDPGPVGLIAAPTYWHAVAFNLALFDRVGLFDENFYVAYGEDADFQRRLMLSGHVLGEQTIPPIDATACRDGHGVDQLRADHPGRTTINYDALMAYFQRKWACDWIDCLSPNGYATPFGDPTRPLSYWPASTIEDLQAEYGIVGR